MPRDQFVLEEVILIVALVSTEMYTSANDHQLVSLKQTRLSLEKAKYTFLSFQLTEVEFRDVHHYLGI